ncbi:hypothetical protein K0C01_12030 [Salinarchaeum sp. IM2453]|nr:hypothetical protein [Salinarchaeum sp. IM2453]QZA88491.1 hypothetical protein K0C01_12030 [Salinarchaeum sp. IM2453]
MVNERTTTEDAFAFVHAFGTGVTIFFLDIPDVDQGDITGLGNIDVD